MKGKVYLVGAGPGDPELLTLKALRLLRSAEAVLHDDLVAPEILKLIPPTAQIYNVGKRCGKKKIRQGEINCLMVALANFRTARGPAERRRSADLRTRRGRDRIPAQQTTFLSRLFPGVTSALGAAAAAQIPLTHRRASSALGAHYRPSSVQEMVRQSDASDWSKLVASGATLVIYMPGQDYADIAKRLSRPDSPLNTPCAIISRATTKYQRTHRTLSATCTRAPELASPTLLVVGEVVRLSDPAAVAAEFIVPEILQLRHFAEIRA